MNKIQGFGLLLNLILYIIITLPIRLLSFYKKIYKNPKKFILILIISIIYFASISILLYKFPYSYFELFTNINGIINYGVYAFKILFLSSSFYSIKLLIPKYLSLIHNKKIVILKLQISKITILILLSIINYLLFNTKGILFTIPLVDFIYSLIYLYLYIKNIIILQK